MNDNILKITGAAELPQELELEEDYTIALTGNIQSKDTRSNNGEGVTIIHRLKLLGQIIISDKHGKNVYGKSKGSVSQRYRNRLRQIHSGDDFDAFWESYMNWKILNAEDHYEEYFKTRL